MAHLFEGVEARWCIALIAETLLLAIGGDAGGFLILKIAEFYGQFKVK